MPNELTVVVDLTVVVVVVVGVDVVLTSEVLAGDGLDVVVVVGVTRSYWGCRLVVVDDELLLSAAAANWTIVMIESEVKFELACDFLSASSLSTTDDVVVVVVVVGESTAFTGRQSSLFGVSAKPDLHEQRLCC